MKYEIKKETIDEIINYLLLSPCPSVDVQNLSKVLRSLPLIPEIKTDDK